MTSNRCPACDKHIINRRRPTCEFCDEPLPFEALMSPDELGAAEERAEEQEKDARAQRAAERVAREEARRRGGPFPGPGGTFPL